jgi:hypothetical protein
MSKSGFKKLTAVLIIAVLVAAGTTAVALANAGGYEKLKEAFFKTMAVENLTAEAKAVFTINGELVASAESLIKANKDREYSKIKYVDFYSGEAKEYENDYVSVYGTTTESLRQFEMATEKQLRLMSLLLDAMAGETRNHFITTDNSVSVDLNETQVPELYQLIAGVSAESIVSGADYYDYKSYSDNSSERNLLDIAATKDFAINKVRAEGTATKDGYLDAVKFYGEIGGRDESGKYIYASFEMDAKFYDINNTEVPPVTDYSSDYDVYSY